MQLKNILLVDDDKVFNFLHEKLLRKLNIKANIHTAENGKAAQLFLQQLSRKGESFPEVIFLDLNMPVMDGFQFLEYSMATNLLMNQSTVIVIVTSSLNRMDEEKVKSFGIRYFISKPVTEDVIQNLLREEGLL